MTTKLVYLASPIDQTGQRTVLAPTIIEQALVDQGHLVFNPAGAFAVRRDTKPTDKAWKVNWRALVLCDGLLAFMPKGVPSIGVPMEVERCRNHKPVAVISDARESWALQAPGMELFPSSVAGVEDAVKWLTQEMDANDGERRLGESTLYWTGDGEPPTLAHPDDAGFDLYVALERPVTVDPGDVVNLPSHVQVELPEGMWGMVIGRSSSFMRGLMVNPAVIDPGYRGELFAVVRNISLKSVRIDPGDRVAQLVPLPAYATGMQVIRTTQLSPSHRGEDGQGSTGR